MYLNNNGLEQSLPYEGHGGGGGCREKEAQGLKALMVLTEDPG